MQCSKGELWVELRLLRLKLSRSSSFFILIHDEGRAVNELNKL